MNDYIPKSKRNGNGNGAHEKKKTERGFVSPNELFKAAKDTMIKGREPESKKDWALIVNYWAYNIEPELAPSATLLLCKIYGVPISEEDIQKIIQFQLKKKR